VVKNKTKKKNKIIKFLGMFFALSSCSTPFGMRVEKGAEEVIEEVVEHEVEKLEEKRHKEKN
jgi:hypothetical protein